MSGQPQLLALLWRVSLVVRTLGCNPISPKNRELQKARIAGARSFTQHVWREDGQPGTFAWDAAFEEILDQRTRLADRYRDAGICLFPWQVLMSLPKGRKLSERFYWNQGSIPSCSMHGAMHSAQASILTDIALGAPRRYDALNPIYPFYLARGGNLAGGLDLAETADQLNTGGAYAVSLVGEDNTHTPRDWRMFRDSATQRQTAIVYLEDDLVEKIFRACRAAFHITFGSGLYYNEAREDENGVKVLYSTGHGGHAQSLGSWRELNGKEYIFLTNSWGDTYGASDEGEPACGGWIDKDALAVLARSMPNYGAPFIALCENPAKAPEARILEKYTIPFPRNWKR